MQVISAADLSLGLLSGAGKMCASQLKAHPWNWSSGFSFWPGTAISRPPSSPYKRQLLATKFGVGHPLGVPLDVRCPLR